jgi:hypothetical protein
VADRLTLGITGLKEINKALRQIDSDAPKGMRVALNGCADFLIDKVRPQIPKKTGAAARSLKARSTRTSVRIAVGGTSAPYYPWLDFGGKVGKNDSVVRPFFTEGRYIYPTFRTSKEEFTKIMDGAVMAVVVGAGLDVT